MGMPPDENLPEVVPDGSPQTVPDGFPQVINQQEAWAHHAALEGSQKYSAYPLESPKYSEPTSGYPDSAGLQSAYYYDHERDPNSGVPWETPTHGEGLQAGAVPTEGTSTYFGSGESEKASPSEDKIFGLRKRAFYAVLAVMLVFLAAAVGAGVGGGLAATNRGSQTSSSGSNSGSSNGGDGGGTSTTPTPTTNDGTNHTNTQPTNPVVTPNLNETGVTGPYEFQGWSGFNYSGQVTPIIKRNGYTDFSFEINSYIWDPHGWTCCVTFCANKTDTSGSYRCGVREQPRSSGPFKRIYTTCGGENITKQAFPCS